MLCLPPVERKYLGFGGKDAIIFGCHKSCAQDDAHFSLRVVTTLFAFDVVVQGTEFSLTLSGRAA